MLKWKYALRDVKGSFKMTNGSSKEIENIISMRRELSKKHGKLTPEEIEWVRTHPAYSEKTGYPNLMMDIIDLEADTEYVFCVYAVKNETHKRIGLIFDVPQGLKKGYIFFDGTQVSSRTGKIVQPQKTDSFCSSGTKENDRIYFRYKSELGKIAVSYECPVAMRAIFMPDKVVMRMLYSKVHQILTMVILESGENRRVYSCTTDEDGTYGKYIFAVEWRKSM